MSREMRPFIKYAHASDPFKVPSVPAVEQNSATQPAGSVNLDRTDNNWWKDGQLSAS